MESPAQKRMRVALSALALCAPLAGGCQNVGPAGTEETDTSGGADGDSDADTGDNGDDDDGDEDDGDEDDGDDDCYEDYACRADCDTGGVVVSEPSGTPAEVGAICASTESTVVSTSAASVELEPTLPPPGGESDIGFVGIPASLLERVTDLPEIELEGLSDSQWDTFEISSLEAAEGGFSFLVTWPTIFYSEETCGEHGPAGLMFRIRFSMTCDAADASVSGDGGAPDAGYDHVVEVQATTYLAWCYSYVNETGGTWSGGGWYASGETCALTCNFGWEGGPC